MSSILASFSGHGRFEQDFLGKPLMRRIDNLGLGTSGGF